MLSISDIKQGTICKVSNEPYEVTWTQQVQMGRGGSILRIKIKNLSNGKVLEKTLKGQDTLESADLTRTKINFLYKDTNGYHFMDNETYEEITFSDEQVGNKKNFLKEGLSVILLKADDQPITIQLPIKETYKVISSPEAVRGDSAQGRVTKTAEIETGYEVQVPLFIKEDELIIVNTEDGSYVERAEKR